MRHTLLFGTTGGHAKYATNRILFRVNLSIGMQPSNMAAHGDSNSNTGLQSIGYSRLSRLRKGSLQCST